jgi:hypothetical protein
MSGSNSSAPDAAPAADPLGLTVYELTETAATDQQRRTRNGRIKMLLVPLIQPTRSLPELTLVALDGPAVPLSTLRGQWLLVALGPGSCDTPCEQRLHAQRQLREMLGRERDRLDKVWLVTDEAPLAPKLHEAVKTEPPVTVLRFPREQLAVWLAPEPGRQLEEHLYLVDPMGEWMMRFPVDFDPTRVKRDIDRLLRASGSWDRAGR